LRFQGKSRLGFFPFPLSEAQRIRSFTLFPVQPSSAIDPCVGDGMAFEAITSDADVLRHGIELDACRAEQAMQPIPNIVQQLTIAVGGSKREAPASERLHESPAHGIACDYSITD